MSLVAFVPLVVVLLALAGCSTNAATNITSSSAYLNGDGNCAGAGVSFTWYYNLWDSQGNIQNGPQYYANCSGYSADQALPSIQFGNLLTGTDHCFAIHAWLHTPHQEFMHFDADGTKNGYHFDCFATQSLGLPEVMPAPNTIEAKASGPPSSGLYSNTRSVAKNFWQSYGEWGSCMENNTRQTSAPRTQFMVWFKDDGQIFISTFKRLEEMYGGTIAAVSVGCNSPGQGTINSDPRIIYNSSLSWGKVGHCIAGTHEWGHQRGFGHGNQKFRIMQYPPYVDFPWC
jgi:hypothetical protein